MIMLRRTFGISDNQRDNGVLRQDGKPAYKKAVLLYTRSPGPLTLIALSSNVFISAVRLSLHSPGICVVREM